MDNDDIDDLPPLEDMSEQLGIIKKEEKEGKRPKDVDYTITRDDEGEMLQKEREELDKKMAKALVGDRRTEGAAPVKREESRIWL